VRRRGAILFLPGRHPNLSRIGSGFPTIRSTASTCWKTACHCSAGKQVRSCFSFRPTLRPMPTGSSPSSSCCRRNAIQLRVPPFKLVRAENTTVACSKAYRCAYPIIMMRRRLGDARPTLSMCAATAPRVATKATIVRKSFRSGLAASGPRRGKAATCSSISTTTRKAQHQPTPEPCVS
jgi:hypothetical protein